MSDPSPITLLTNKLVGTTRGFMLEYGYSEVTRDVCRDALAYAAAVIILGSKSGCGRDDFDAALDRAVAHIKGYQDDKGKAETSTKQADRDAGDLQRAPNGKVPRKGRRGRTLDRIEWLEKNIPRKPEALLGHKPVQPKGRRGRKDRRA